MRYHSLVVEPQSLPSVLRVTRAARAMDDHGGSRTGTSIFGCSSTPIDSHRSWEGDVAGAFSTWWLMSARQQ